MGYKAAIMVKTLLWCLEFVQKPSTFISVLGDFRTRVIPFYFIFGLLDEYTINVVNWQILSLGISHLIFASRIIHLPVYTCATLGREKIRMEKTRVEMMPNVLMDSKSMLQTLPSP